jgi:hypothetical protein
MREVIIIRESVLVSWAKDVFTWGCLFAMYWLNHKYLGGAWVVDVTTSFAVLIMALSIAIKRTTYTVDDAIKKLESLRGRRL